MHVLQGCSDTSRRFAPTDILAHFLLDDQVAEARCLAIGSCRAKLLVSAASSDLHDLEEFFCCSTGQGRVQRCLSKPIAFPIKDSRLLSSCF